MRTIQLWERPLEPMRSAVRITSGSGPVDRRADEPIADSLLDREPIRRSIRRRRSSLHHDAVDGDLFSRLHAKPIPTEWHPPERLFDAVVTDASRRLREVGGSARMAVLSRFALRSSRGICPSSTSATMTAAASK
jgi:hypothetical protein